MQLNIAPCTFQPHSAKSMYIGTYIKTVASEHFHFLINKTSSRGKNEIEELSSFVYTMNQTKFKKDIQKKTKLTIKNDSSNLLIYLIYVNYFNNLIENSTSNNEITMTNLIKENETLLKKFRG